MKKKKQDEDDEKEDSSSVAFSTHQVFGVSWICVIHHTILSIDVKFVPQGCATWGHSYRRLRGHTTMRGQTLGTVTWGSAKIFNILKIMFLRNSLVDVFCTHQSELTK